MSQNREPFRLKKRLRSFSYAFSGIRNLLLYEHNFRIHVVVAILTAVLGIVLHLSLWQWAVIAIAIFMVLIAEIINSAIENLADVVSPEYSEAIKRIKDYCAAAVLLASILAVIAGLLVFLPEIIRLL
jgi:diacylglycerol kinase (ATP)